MSWFIGSVESLLDIAPDKYSAFLNRLEETQSFDMLAQTMRYLWDNQPSVIKHMCQKVGKNWERATCLVCHLLSVTFDAEEFELYAALSTFGQAGGSLLSDVTSIRNSELRSHHWFERKQPVQALFATRDIQKGETFYSIIPEEHYVTGEHPCEHLN